jgi:hypothetical protein
MANAMLESPSVLLLPLLVAAPELVAVGVVLSVGLSLAGVYYTLNERQFVLKYGVNFFGRPSSRDEVDMALGMSIAAVVVEAGVAAGVAATGARQLVSRLRHVTPEMLRDLAGAAPRPLRLALQRLRPHVLARLIEAAEISNPRLLLRAYAQVMHGASTETPLVLLDMELQQIFTADYLWFRAEASDLKVLYTRYTESLGRKLERGSSRLASSQVWRSRVRKARVSPERFAAGTLTEADIERLTPEPLEWVLASRDPAVKAVMQRRLGPDWVRKIKRFKPHVPMRADEVEIFDFLSTPLPYDLAKRLRDTPGKAYGRFFEFDHPFERRFVKALARRFKVKAATLLRYETADVLIVPKNMQAARRLPRFADYVHYPKTRRLEVLIAFGRESEYTLQQIRDAHVFTIASYGRADSPAIAMVDKVVADIARKTGQTVKLGHIPEAGMFAEGAWTYFLPTEAYAMRRTTYLRHLDLLEEDLQRVASTSKAAARP